jgi:methionyl-tRNA formyltransferase
MLDAEGYPHAFLKTGRFTMQFTRATLNSENELFAQVKISVEQESEK